MKNTEVEIKHTLPDPDELRRRLHELDAISLGETRQVDLYFNAPHTDFLAADVVSEWLRLRTETTTSDEAGTTGKASINFKRWHPVGAVKATHCDEYETGVDNAETLHHLLKALGYTEMVTVDKTRAQWRLPEVTVAVDTVANLGSFVEFEYDGDAATVEEATAALRATIDKIGVKLGGRDRRGYPYILLGRKR